MTPSIVHSYIGPRDVRPFVIGADDVADVFGDLPKLGISGLSRRAVLQMIAGMDDLQGGLLPMSTATPVQFLQNWLPGFIATITQARKADELLGVLTAGDWEDEEIVQMVMELLGGAVPYTDTGNIPFSSWNFGFERRSIIRFEEGMHAGKLEEARAAKFKINSGESKRNAAATSLEVKRNSVAFYGYNGGLNRTYGFLNDPNLPAATAFPNGAGGSPHWDEKTFLEITKDIRLMADALRSQSGDTIDPYKTPTTLAVATDAVGSLAQTADNGGAGYSVMDWMKKTYPNMRVISAPELNGAVAGDNEGYLYAETVGDAEIDQASTDDKKIFVQIVPTRFRLIGVEAGAKGYKEDYSNATAGAFLKRPFGVVRRYAN